MKKKLLVLLIVLIANLTAVKAQNAQMTIDAGDTVTFNFSNALCTGSYITIPVSVLSDDIVYAIDFSMKYDETKISFDSLINHTNYLGSSAYYNTADSTLRFTSFSMQPVANDTPLISLRFELLTGEMAATDFNSINSFLNGDQCSYKLIDTLPAASITPNEPVIFFNGDSVSLSAIERADYSYLWSTGETSPTITVVDTGLYMVTITNAGGCTSTATVNVTVNTPLPVVLVDFKIEEHVDGLLLSWITATETNNDYFTIERSADCKSWEKINKVMGSGNSNTIRYYNAVDYRPLAGINYYRLKQTDYDGTCTYSKVKVFNFSESEHFVFNLFPNPASGTLNVESDENAELQLLNCSGVVVTTPMLVTGNQRQMVDIRNFSNGIYVVKLYNDSFIAVKKVMIRN